MSVSGISSFTAAQFGASPSMDGVGRRRQEDALGRQLEQALQNGDLATAQAIYQKLAAFGTDNSGPFKDSKLQAEFQTLGMDLQKGDLASAQSDASTLGSDLLKHDMQVARNLYNSGNSPLDFQKAMENFKNDYWAVFGSTPSMSDIQSFMKASDSSSGNINVQA